MNPYDYNVDSGDEDRNNEYDYDLNADDMLDDWSADETAD